MPSAARLAVELLTADQASAEVTANSALTRLDAFVQMRFKDRDLSAAPVSPADGDVYLVKPTPAGGDPWVGQSDKIAFYYSGWRFFTPVEGMIAWIEDEDKFVVYNGASWADVVSGATGAPAGAAYVVLAGDATLTGERTLTAGAMISLADTGSNGTITVAVPVNPTIPGGASVLIPAGTTAQRPGSPANGMIRYNTTTAKFEAFENGAWINMVGGGATPPAAAILGFKDADQSISVNGPTADPDLLFAVDANGKYRFEFDLRIFSAGGQTHTLGFLGPAAPVQFWFTVYGDDDSVGTLATVSQKDGTSFAIQLSCQQTGNGDRTWHIRGGFRNGANAGTVILQHGIVGAPVTPHVVRRCSSSIAYKV